MTDEKNIEMPEVPESSEEGSSPEPVSLLEMVQAHVLGVVDSKVPVREWFRDWLPVVMRAQKLAASMMKIGWHLKDEFGEDATDDFFPEPLLAAVMSDVQALVEEFPDVMELLVGVDKLDALIRDLSTNEESRQLLAKAFDMATTRLDVLGAKIVNLAFFAPETSRVSPETILEFLQRAEVILDYLLTRWILPRVPGLEPEP